MEYYLLDHTFRALKIQRIILGRKMSQMSHEATPTPTPGPNKAMTTLKTALKGALWLVLVAIISAASAYGVFEWRAAREVAQVRQTQEEAAAQVAALRETLERRQAELEAKVSQMEEQVALVGRAAEEARLLFEKDGEAISLEARLQEIDTLRLELEKAQEEFAAQLNALEQSVVDQVARQGEETAQALSLELRWKSLLIKAQGEALLALFYYAEGNRGLAKDELTVAAATLQQALEEAPEEVREQIRPVTDLAEEAKSALILEQPSARDQLNLLWHRINALIAR